MTDLVQDLVNKLLSDSVVTPSVIVGCILLASDHLLGVKETSVCASANFVDHVGLKIAVDCTRDVFSVAWSSLSQQMSCQMYAIFVLPTSFGEEGAEPLIRVGSFALLRKISIGLNEVDASVCIQEWL